MAELEPIAATLTAALLRSLPNAGLRVPSAGGAIDRVEVARHAVGLYETILGMLAARPKDAGGSP